MARLLRGTIHQQGLALNDEAVEKTANAYTLSNPNFWEDYYSTVDAERFDWYGTWDTDITWDGGGTSSMGSVLRPFLRADAEILMVGCGRSEMSQQMYREGFQRITNIDISRPLLESLQRKLGEEMSFMSWRWMNASSLLLPDDSMDVVIEKGTLDSLQDNLPLFEAAVREMHRVLRTGEVLISITDADRLSELQTLAPFRCQGFAGEVAHQKRLRLYVCHKKPESMLDELKSWFKLEL